MSDQKPDKSLWVAQQALRAIFMERVVSNPY